MNILIYFGIGLSKFVFLLLQKEKDESCKSRYT